MNIKSIRFRISAVILICAFCGVLLFEFFWVPRLNNLLVETQTNELQTSVQILADGVLPYLVSNQIGAVYETLNSVQDRYSYWISVTLHRSDGTQLFPLAEEASSFGKNFVKRETWINFQGEDIARLSVIADSSPQIQRFQQERKRMFLILGVIISILYLGNVFLVDRLITRPVRQLKQAADELANQNYDADLPKGSDEVGLLAKSFSDMREHIQDHAACLEAARKKAEVALEARSRFLAVMSHEIRTPLNGIIPVAELLMNSDLEPSQFAKADIIVTSGKALSSIVNDILDVSMLDGGKLSIQSVEFSPNEVVKDALDVVHSTARHKGLELINGFDAPADLRLCGDPERLRQVLINLMGNAIKFTKTGSIMLSGFAKPSPSGSSQLHLEVTDTGIGIPEDAMSRIFNRFEQVDDRVERRFGGTGLGLSIVKDLIEAMNGSVTIQSTLGEGSTFNVDLELDIVTGASVESHDQPIHVPSPDCERTALIVDDNEVNRVVGSAILDRLGYKVILAENGIVGVTKAAENKFDVILMDMHMPEMDGLLATQNIRARNGPNSETKIIALTASVLAEDIEKCRVAGMDDFLSKPINIKNLSTMLQ